MAVPVLPQAVITRMADRQHRMGHMLWHATRNFWPLLPPQLQQQIRSIDPAWEPPRFAFDAQRNRLRDNGEDFLYMHRQMIAEVNAILAQVNDPQYPRVQGWTELPAPGDPEYPVVSVPELQDDNGRDPFEKTDEFYYTNLLPIQYGFATDRYLRNVALAQLGSDIEWSIHGAMHIRYATPEPNGVRPSPTNLQGVFAPPSQVWDDPAYDFLGDTYSSHVNPVFWKLHG